MEVSSEVAVAVVSAVGGGGVWSFLSSKLNLGAQREERLMSIIQEERNRTDSKLAETTQILIRTNAILFILLAELQRLDPKNPVVKYALDSMQDIAQKDVDGVHRQMEQMRASAASVVERMSGNKGAADD